MIVGPTGSGKSVAYQTLLSSINSITKKMRKTKQWKSDDDLQAEFRYTVSRIVNPKSILNEQI